MQYSAYRTSTERAAAAIGAPVVSLAGGYYGLHLTMDGTHAVVCRDLDGNGEWCAWTEDRHGERCCDYNTVTIGDVRPRDYGTLPALVASALAGHVCSCWSCGGAHAHHECPRGVLVSHEGGSDFPVQSFPV